MTNYIDDTRAWITSRAGIIDSHVYDGQVCYITGLLYMGIISTLLCSAMFLFSSCTNHDDVVIYSIEHDESDVIKQPLIDWTIFGALSSKEDSLYADSFISSPSYFMEKCKADTARTYLFSGNYHPLYNQLDLREVYGILPEDTTHSLEGKVTYLHCEITSDDNMTLYLEVKSSMSYNIFVNTDTLLRRDIQGLNIYPMHLKKGRNRCFVKLNCTGGDYSFESTVYDSISIARLYADGQSCNIIYPQIDSVSHVVMLTNAHQNVINSPVSLKFYDVYGKPVSMPVELKKDSFTYYVDGLENNTSYMCEMTICDYSIRQPVLCGKDDNAYKKFSLLREELSDGHPRSAEIDQLLFRLNFLLNHPTRYDGDWWWQFKISPLTYQLEHTLKRLECVRGEDDTEANVLFVTYRSEIDDSLQRYILARPNHINKSTPLPLVVVIRPNIENLHHFFACPQLARQWAVNQMQALSNKYGFLIVMPEIRTYQHEDLLPIAEEELKLVIKDIQQHYSIDTSRMFLHANCSGGYRALRLATDYPKMFKALALYAPLYHRSFSDEWSNEHKPELFINKLKNVPMFIHGDPVDKHSPYSIYKDLIDDCKRYDIPLTLSFKLNSGKYYNVVLVGEEALDFFETLR